MKATVIIKVLVLVLAGLLMTTSIAFASPTADERAILNLLNTERKEAGLSTLKWGPRLEQAARRHSRDMIDKGYFAHQSPSGLNLADRLHKSGLKGWTSAGENLAGAGSVEVAFKLWMASQAHKNNMLKAGYTHVGIGIVAGGPYGMMFTMDLAQNPVAEAKIARAKATKKR